MHGSRHIAPRLAHLLLLALGPACTPSQPPAVAPPPPAQIVLPTDPKVEGKPTFCQTTTEEYVVGLSAALKLDRGDWLLLEKPGTGGVAIAVVRAQEAELAKVRVLYQTEPQL